MKAGWLNFGSMTLGVLTLLLPCVILALHKRLHPLAVSLMSFGSLAACATSLSFQIFYQEHLVNITDWGAMRDIAGPLSRIVTMFLLATLLLNALALGVFYGAAKWSKSSVAS